MRRLSKSLALLVLSVSAAAPQQRSADAARPLPRVVLLGDSVRLGYAPAVARRLEGKAVVISAADNGGDSANLLAHLDAWVSAHKPDVVHWNAGLHDLKVARGGRARQVELDAYRANLRAIAARIRDGGAASIFATSTPVDDARHARRGAAFDRANADVDRYNAAAVETMRGEGVPVDDLGSTARTAPAGAGLGPDGVHFTAAGYERLAEAVADCVVRALTIRFPRPLTAPASGPEAAARYREAEAARDGLVPERYRTIPGGELRQPSHAAEWSKARPAVRKIVVDSLGDLPPRPSPPRVRVVSRELRRGFTVEKVALDNGVDGEVTALLLVPEKRAAPAPAILWLHSSTPDCNQILTPNTNGGAEALGETLVGKGYVVLSPDAYWHGDRVGTGPAGSAETGREEQESLFKLHLWLGRTLWGMFVRDDQVALDYLASRPEVDRRRIGATGMSMGSTRAWWLAAVDERIAATVAVACLTRYRNLIAHGQLRQHGIYYFASGLLRHFDTEGVLALLAPRPFLALTGDLDAGSPADGIRVLEDRVGRIYATVGAPDRFRSVLYPGVGHAYTPEMREAMLAWFDRWLRQPS